MHTWKSNKDLCALSMHFQSTVAKCNNTALQLLALCTIRAVKPEKSCGAALCMMMSMHARATARHNPLPHEPKKYEQRNKSSTRPGVKGKSIIPFITSKCKRKAS